MKKKYFTLVIVFIMCLNIMPMNIFANTEETNKIQTVEVINVADPVVGEKPSRYYTVPEDSNYRIKVEESVIWFKTTNKNVTIEDINTMWDNWDVLASDNFTFEKDFYYTVSVTVVPNEGYVFGEDIRVTINGKTAFTDYDSSVENTSVNIYYTFKPTTVKLEKNKLKAGETTKVNLTNVKRATYISLNPKIVKITEAGEIIALKKGTAKISINFGGRTVIKKIKVTSNPVVKKGGKTVRKGTFTIKKGKNLKLNILGKASKIKNKVTFTKGKIAKNTSKLTKPQVVIKGLKKGTTKVNITINGVKTYIYKIKVK